MAITDGVIAADPDEWTTTCQPKLGHRRDLVGTKLRRFLCPKVCSLRVKLCAIAVHVPQTGSAAVACSMLSAHFAREQALAHYNSFHVVIPHGVYLFLLATGLMKGLGMYVTRLWLNS
jgi:hypothetical protein